MSKIKIRGGLRLGIFNVSWPLATLEASKYEMIIKALILGTFNFRPKDIIEIRPYGNIPLIGKGIKVVHNKENVNSHIVFWTFGDREQLISDLHSLGYGK